MTAQQIPTQFEDRVPVVLDELKRGDYIVHTVLGTCAYVSRERGQRRYTHIRVQQTNYAAGREVVVTVPLADCFKNVGSIAKKKQKTRLFLAVCVECQMKIRASLKTYELGTPLCWNVQCARLGKPLDIQMGDDENNPAKLDADMREVGNDVAIYRHESGVTNSANVKRGEYVQFATTEEKQKALDAAKNPPRPEHVCPFSDGEHIRNKAGVCIACEGGDPDDVDPNAYRTKTAVDIKHHTKVVKSDAPK